MITGLRIRLGLGFYGALGVDFFKGDFFIGETYGEETAIFIRSWRRGAFLPLDPIDST